MVALGIGLGAVQIVPLYEVVQSSFRQGAVTLQQVLGWAYPKRRLITFLVPNFFGNPTHRSLQNVLTGELIKATTNAHGEPIQSFDWGIKNYVEGGAYLGLLPLLFALLGVTKPLLEISSTAKRLKTRLLGWLRDPYVPFFTGLALFSLGCIFGTPLYALVYALPLLSQSHSPFRWVFPLTVAVAALTALGATLVTNHRRDRTDEENAVHRNVITRVLLFDTAPNAVSVLAALTLWGGILLLGGLWTSRFAFARIEPFVERLFWSLAKAPAAFPNHRAFYAYEFRWIQHAALLLIASGIVLRVSRCPIYLPKPLHRHRIWKALAVIVLLVDLVSFGAGFHPQVDPALLETTPPVVDFLRQDTGVWRFSTFDPHGHKIFNANTGMYFGFQDVRGYDSLFTAQYTRFMSWIEPQNELPYNRIAPFREYSSLDSPLTDLLNVKYIVTDVEIPLPKYELVYQDDAVRVYENLGVMSRAFTLPQSATLVVSDAEAVGTAIQSYDPRFYTIVESAAEGWSQSPPDLTQFEAPEQADAQPQPIVDYGINQVVIEATVETDSWLILGDSYFPGWKAFVRPQGTGEEAEEALNIARVAGNFRGVQLEPGTWTVRFKYSPNSVKFGAFISFLSGMILLFLGVIWTWRRFYREETGASVIQRIAKNSIASIALNLFNRLVDFAFAALMLRILGPENAGDYYYAGTVFMWFQIMANFGLDAYLTREIARHRDTPNRFFVNATGVRLGITAIGLPVLFGFIGLRQNVIASPASTQAITALVLLYVGLFPNAISQGLTSLFYAYEKAEYPAAISTVTTLLKVTLGTVALLAGWGIIGLAAVSIVSNVITLIVMIVIVVRRFFRPRWTSDGPLRREMIASSWPLMLNNLLATLFFKVDIFLLEAMARGGDVVGLYSVGYKYLEALNIIPAMFTLSGVFPVLSRQAVHNQGKFRRFYRLGVKILVGIALPAALLTTLAAPEMVLLLGGRQYLPGSRIALRLMVWSIPIGWINSLTQYVLIALDQQRFLTRAFTFGFAFTLIANLIFIPRYGYQASAVIHVFAELMLLIPFILGVRRQIGDLRWIDTVGKPLFATLVTGAVVLPLYLWIGRGWAITGALLTYPLISWRIGVLSQEERAALAPLLHKQR
jgi:O-antigen/teichoic acid export membrane protein